MPAKTADCFVCGRTLGRQELVPIVLLREPLLALIRADHPDLPADAQICHADLARYRARHAARLLEEERGELTRLEQDVVRKLAEGKLIAENVDLEFDRRRTAGQWLADRVAAVGGSWWFVIGFFTFLIVWMIVNALLLAHRAFDPYPFILLNLVLSCLAAIQAPIIMMSQNRQEAKDRLRAENDFRVNLKAELEVRMLGERLDHLLNEHWRRLMEIQQIQVELMEQIGGGGEPA